MSEHNYTLPGLPGNTMTPEELRRKVTKEIAEPDRINEGAGSSVPCPFDRGGGVLRKVVDQWYVICTSCGATGPSDETPKGALEAWEMRADTSTGFDIPEALR